MFLKYPLLRNGIRRKVFISYYHKEDDCYRKKFEELFGHLFINKSVKDGDIKIDNSAEYINRLIQEDYLSDTSVLVVLVGNNSHRRKHVDWEISAALNKKVDGYSGLLGLRLPSRLDFNTLLYDPETIPSRLLDNLNSGYANFYDWTWDGDAIVARVEEAFRNRIFKSDKIKNSRLQLANNRPEPLVPILNYPILPPLPKMLRSPLPTSENSASSQNHFGNFARTQMIDQILSRARNSKR